jgi:hypothetical protein
MRFLKICLLVVSLGLLLTLVSCSSDEATPDDTKAFLNGLNSMMMSAYMSEASQAMQSFGNSNPPGPSIVFNEDVGTPAENLRKMRDPMGLDTLYGTWDYIDFTGWVHTDPDNPANAILFTWEYLDSAGIEHDAELLVDSLEFYEATDDTLPTNIWIGLASDGDDLAWIKFSAHYVSADVADEASLVYEIVNYFQIGATITSDVAVDTTLLDSMDFVGTVHLWIEDLQTDYRVDYRATRYEDDSGLLVLEDSDDWEMELNVSEVVEYGGEYDEYEKREVDGEITYNGDLVATIEGYIWNPEGEDYVSEVTLIFSDDTEDDFMDYAGVLTLLFASM